MGYRSNGAFRATGKTDELFAVIANLRLTYPDQKELKDALTYCTLKGRMFGFDIDSWKWYSGYWDVQAFEAIMRAFRDNEEISTAFVRIGEVDTAIETEYTGDACYDLIDLIRTYETVDYEDGPNLLSSTIDETRSEDVNQELVPLQAG